MATGVDSASNRNEYQGFLLKWGGGKGGRCVGLTTLTPSCAASLEIWEPQTPGTPQGLYKDCFTSPFTRLCWTISNFLHLLPFYFRFRSNVFIWTVKTSHHTIIHDIAILYKTRRKIISFHRVQPFLPDFCSSCVLLWETWLCNIYLLNTPRHLMPTRSVRHAQLR